MNRTFSYSSLKCFNDCPKQFKFQYVDKTKVPKVVTPETYLGQAIHRVLSTLYSLGADGILVPRQDAAAAYHLEWNKLDKGSLVVRSDYYTVDDYIRIGEEMLLRHYEKYQPFNPGTLLGTEMHLSFEIPGTVFKLRGYLDRLWKREDGVVEICDYKTGQTLPRPHDPQFFYQMGIYQMAVQANYPQFDRIELAQYFLRRDETVCYRMRPDELEQLTEELRVAIVAALEAERLDSFPTEEGRHCDYCDYFDLCPAKRHRRILDLEEAEGEECDRPTVERLKDLANSYLAANEKLQTAKAELEALKEDIRQAARDHGLTRLCGDTGDVKVKLTRSEKFITKTNNPREFAELLHIARGLGLDDYFTLDSAGLMKEIYQKKQLPPDQLEQLKRFVVEQESSRITASLRKDNDLKDE